MMQLEAMEYYCKSFIDEVGIKFDSDVFTSTVISVLIKNLNWRIRTLDGIKSSDLFVWNDSVHLTTDTSQSRHSSEKFFSSFVPIFLYFESKFPYPCYFDIYKKQL